MRAHGRYFTCLNGALLVNLTSRPSSGLNAKRGMVPELRTHNGVIDVPTLTGHASSCLNAQKLLVARVLVMVKTCRSGISRLGCVWHS